MGWLVVNSAVVGGNMVASEVGLGALVEEQPLSVTAGVFCEQGEEKGEKMESLLSS